MHKEDPGRELVPGGTTYVIKNIDFGGKDHGLKIGMEAKECVDGWFQVFKINSHYKHFTRLGPEFIKEWPNHLHKK